MKKIPIYTALNSSGETVKGYPVVHPLGKVFILHYASLSPMWTETDIATVKPCEVQTECKEPPKDMVNVVDVEMAKALHALDYNGEYKYVYYVGENKDQPIPAPRLDDAAYWFCDKYKLAITAGYNASTMEWIWEVCNTRDTTEIYFSESFMYGMAPPSNRFEAYKEALEDAIGHINLKKQYKS